MPASRLIRAALALIAFGLAHAAAAPTASAQGPTPPYPRSGLLSRFTPPPEFLPPDADRDVFTGTRFENRNFTPQEIANNPLRQGLYGHMLPGDCTESYSPYFNGRSGSTYREPKCKPPHPIHRLSSSILHPFKPVSYYYSGGSWVPVYDLDPWAIGPGTYPYPYTFDHNKGG
jgi:hypothetical protein